MKSLTVGRFSMATNIVFATCLAFAAHGSTSVFDDAVFWFRGGKDKNGNGYMQQGEFFDDLHANDAGHANHNMSMSTSYWTGENAGYRANATFRDEQVSFPSMGTNIVENMRVLRISNVKGNSKYFPFVVNPHSVFANNNISNEYTIVSRIKLDWDGNNRNQCLLRLGYNESQTNGMWLGFTKPTTAWYAGCQRLAAYCAPNSDSKVSACSFNLPVPTNTWVDIAVVVGNGKLRVGVAAPVSLTSHNNNPTIAFDETPMWTDNCPLLGNNYYRMFCLKGQTEALPSSDSAFEKNYFLGSVQQLAIWGRALSDQDVMAAFGMPRPAIFRTGFDNRNSNEFGGTRSGDAQTIDGLGSWQNVSDTMLAGDEWTVNFDALRDEAGLPQIFSLRTLSSSAPADIEVALNGTSLGARRVMGNAHAFWPVAANLLVEGANTLTVRRTDSGADSFRMDAMELGGSLGVGTEAASTDDGRTPPSRTATGVPSAADPNLQHWPQELQPYSGVTNLRFRVWVDPDVVNVASFKFRTLTLLAAKSGKTLQGDEKFTLFVNGTKEDDHGTDTEIETIDLNFAPGELLGGWNLFELKSANYDNCHWFVGYYRFETVLPRAFSLPQLGFTVLFK